jgi:hypothetical protein
MGEASQSQFESDQFLKLLTDALRAGPGSPEWHQAVTRLRAANPGEADEYRLLITARERLESGREYRSVRAGPNFTRKVMDAIDEEAERKGGIPSANLIALLAAAVILGVVILVGVWLSKGPPTTPGPQDLAATYFGTPAVSTDFSQGIGPGWKTFGLEPVVLPDARALRGGWSAEDKSEYRGGGIVTADSFSPDSPFAIDVTVRMAKPSSAVDLRVFVTDDPTFDHNREATTPSEFAVDLMNGQVSVFMPDGTLVGQGGKVEREPVHLLVKVNQRFVVVELEGQRLYAQEHHLSPDKQRFAGVRFLTKGPEKAMEDVTVQAVRSLKP